LLGGPATFARDNATLNINVYNNKKNNNKIGIGLPVDGGSQYRYREGQKLKCGHVT